MSDSSIMNPSIILAKAASLLPSSNEFRLKSPAAVLTVLIHAVQLSHGFKLADSKDHAEQTLPQSLFDSQNWKLKYSHPQSRVGFELVVTVLGPRLLVNGMDDKVTNSISSGAIHP